MAVAEVMKVERPAVNRLAAHADLGCRARQQEWKGGCVSKVSRGNSHRSMPTQG